MKKRKIDFTTNKKLFSPFGGHLIDPIEECEYKKRAPDNGVWVDLGCCQIHSCKDKCQLYKWFCKANQSERIQRSIDCGVNIKIDRFQNINLTSPKEEKPKRKHRRRKHRRRKHRRRKQ